MCRLKGFFRFFWFFSRGKLDIPNIEIRVKYPRNFRWHLRMGKCEGLFAEAKQNHGLARARYRGRQKVQIQAYLSATVQNLKRLVFLFCSWLITWWLHDLRPQIQQQTNLARAGLFQQAPPFSRNHRLLQLYKVMPHKSFYNHPPILLSCCHTSFLVASLVSFSQPGIGFFKSSRLQFGKLRFGYTSDGHLT